MSQTGAPILHDDLNRRLPHHSLEARVEHLEALVLLLPAAALPAALATSMRICRSSRYQD